MIRFAGHYVFVCGKVKGSPSTKVDMYSVKNDLWTEMAPLKIER